jgi:hypothetical protein
MIPGMTGLRAQDRSSATACFACPQAEGRQHHRLTVRARPAGYWGAEEVTEVTAIAEQRDAVGVTASAPGTRRLALHATRSALACPASPLRRVLARLP